MSGPGDKPKPWTERQRERARRVRAQGKGRFIVWRGVVGWGVPTAVLFSALMAWLDDGQTFLGNLAVAIVIFPICGILWGAYMWRWLERRWERNDLDGSA